MLDPFEVVSSGSALAYVVIALAIAGSAVFPPLPSETMMFTAGAAVGADALPLVPVLVAGALGSLLGDVTGYVVGRTLGERALKRFARGDRGKRSVAWARRTLGSRGGPLVAVARFIPGGQTAVTVTAGSLGFPRRRFAIFAGLGAVVWAVYGTLVGALGGDAVRSGSWVGLVAAVAIVLAVGVVAEVARRRQDRGPDEGSDGRPHDPVRPDEAP